MTHDGRKDEAKAIPILEVWERLGAPERLIASGAERIGPCPVCGGRDRFGINTARNIFNCRTCGGGDQIKLVEHVQGCDFRAALAFLCGEADVSLSPEEAARRRRERERRRREQDAYAERQRRYAIEHARAIWAAALPGAGTAAEAYLARRGITLRRWPDCLRFIPQHPYVKGKGDDRVTYHVGPAMVASVESPGRGVTAVHQTWLDLGQPKGKADIRHPKTGEPQAAKLVRGSKSAGAIRLYSSPRLMAGDGGDLVIGEGIETTLTALSRNVPAGASFWAGVDLGHMAGRMTRAEGVRWSGEPDMADTDCLRVPAGLQRLFYIQDGDSSPKMTRAKLLSGLKRHAWRQPGLKISIVHPGEGRDLNDLAMEGADE